MKYTELTKGYRIEFKRIEEDKLIYKQSPIYPDRKMLNERLTELYNDHAVQDAVVVEVRYFDKVMG